MNSKGQGIDREKRILDYDESMGYDGMEEILGILSERYGGMRMTALGSSVLGRSIPMISLGNGKKEILYIGCARGRDYPVASLLLRFINEYCELRRTNRRIYNLSLAGMEETRTIHIIPMLNPDGVYYATEGYGEDNPLRGRLPAMRGKEDFSGWAANGRGVDLERNFNFDFLAHRRSEGAGGAGSPSGYGGIHPESEPESAALCNYLRFNDKIKLCLSFRMGCECVLWVEDDELPRSRSVGQSISRICGKPLSRCGAEELRGSLIGWCGRGMGIPSYAVACGGPEDEGGGCFRKYAGVRELFFTAPVLV